MDNKKLPSLKLNQIKSNDLSKLAVNSSKLLMGIALVGIMGACSDNDVSTYADYAADSYDNGSYDPTDSYDVGAYDVSDSDVSSTADK